MKTLQQKIKNLSWYDLTGGIKDILNDIVKNMYVPKDITATAVLDFPSTQANSSSILTVNVVGAKLGDIVVFSGITPPAGSSILAYISSDNTVTVELRTGASVVDLASSTFKIKILK